MSRYRPGWERRYGQALFATDALAVVFSTFGAQWLRFGFTAQDLMIPMAHTVNFAITYSVVSLLVSVLWLTGLAIGRTRDPKIFGTGAAEFRRVLDATLLVFGIAAILAFAIRAPLGRSYLMIALPVGLLLLLLGRLLWRRRLHAQRKLHRNQYRTLVVGSTEQCSHVVRQIVKNSNAGFDLLGAVTESGRGDGNGLLLPVLADYNGLLEAVDANEIETLIVASPDTISPAQLKRLGWELERRRVELIVTVALTDIAAPRIHTRPVAGLPLIHVEHPLFSGRRLITKRLFDVVGSGLLLVLFSPVFLVVATIVRVDSPGPALFRQRRVGLDGREFSMLKFRSMSVDAERRRSELLDLSEGNSVLFKLKHDPRVTRVGAVLRRYSIDELPQLVNVIRGDMSLIGPRPPLPSEVEHYEGWVNRRLLVRPGLTGLWQVSGRSDLSWEESVRLDLSYVENRSLTGDLLILWRTVGTVLRSEGAY